METTDIGTGSTGLSQPPFTGRNDKIPGVTTMDHSTPEHAQHRDSHRERRSREIVANNEFKTRSSRETLQSGGGHGKNHHSKMLVDSINKLVETLKEDVVQKFFHIVKFLNGKNNTKWSIQHENGNIKKSS